MSERSSSEHFPARSKEYVRRKKGMEKLKNKKMAVRLLWATFGSLLFAAGVNIIILPLHLYNGTFLGIAQLIRTFLVDYLEDCRA